MLSPGCLPTRRTPTLMNPTYRTKVMCWEKSRTSQQQVTWDRFSIAIQIQWKFRFILTVILTATKFCTWHDSTAVVPCTKICCNLMAKQRNYSKAKFLLNLNCGHKIVIETGPCHLSHKCSFCSPILQGAQPLEKCWNFNPLLEKCWNLDWALKIVQNPSKVLEKWHFSLNLFQNQLVTVDTSLICKISDYMFSYFSVFATSWVRWTTGQIVRVDCTPVCL